MLRQVNINVANNSPMRTPIGMNAGMKETFTSGQQQHKVPTINFNSSGENKKFAKEQPHKLFPTINTGLKEKFVIEQRKVYPTDPDLCCTYTGWAKKDCYEDIAIRQLETAPFQPLVDDWPKEPTKGDFINFESWILEEEENSKN